MKIQRNPHLTPAMERVLKWMIGAGVEGELVTEGREAWYGLHRTSPAVVMRLLQLCLLHDDSPNGAMGDDKFRHYSVNEEGRKIVNQPNYVPLILRTKV